MRKWILIGLFFVAAAPVCAATPAYVQSCSGQGNNLQTQNCTLASSVTKLDAVLVMAEMASNVTTYTVTDSLSTPFVLIRSDPYTGSNMHTNNVWCGIAPSTGSDTITSLVTSGTGTHYADLIVVQEFSGISCSPVGQNATTGTTSMDPQTVLSTALSSTAPNQMMAQFACVFNASADYATTSWSAGQVSPQALRDSSCTGAHLLASSVGSYQAPYNVHTGTGNYEIQFMIFPGGTVRHRAQIY